MIRKKELTFCISIPAELSSSDSAQVEIALVSRMGVLHEDVIKAANALRRWGMLRISCVVTVVSTICQLGADVVEIPFLGFRVVIIIAGGLSASQIITKGPVRPYVLHPDRRKSILKLAEVINM